ncbi:MAG: sodium:calcium antiporter [Chloroflexi bacterium]|nr:sodium:calcium antiporter [Chloroflexota bacterium]
MVDIIVLAISFLLILAGADLFTNGIEWFGRKLGLGDGAVGSVLAAVGTALPETMIPIIAIAFSDRAETSGIGIGAILGAPFMLATLAMFVTGLAVMWQARHRAAGDVMPVDVATLGLDIRTFALAYAIAIGAAFLPVDPTWPKLVVAAGLVLIYGLYVRRHFQADAAGELADLAPLRFRQLDRAHRHAPGPPRLWIVNIQVVTALAFIVLGAIAFVGAVEHVAYAIGVSQVLLALIVAPIATELPEKFNSIIWVRQGKDTLAMGNITGAMVFQASLPTVVALVLVPGAWVIAPGSYVAFASAGIAFLSAAAIFIPMIRRGRLIGKSLLLGGLFYAAYLGIVVAAILRPA